MEIKLKLYCPAGSTATCEPVPTKDVPLTNREIHLLLDGLEELYALNRESARDVKHDPIRSDEYRDENREVKQLLRKLDSLL